MDRVFASGASETPPSVPTSPSSGYPSKGNAGAGTPATKLGEYWYYMITEELRKVITDAGMTPDHANLTQLSAAIQQLISNSVQAPGSVIYVAKASAPSGYLKANGAAISRTTYAALFTAIGTTYGAGDGSTTFNLPDLRGEFIRGFDDGRGVDTGRTLGSAQADALQNITGSALIRSPGSSSSGAFTQTGSTSVAYGGSSSASQYTLNFDASLVARTAAETRPRNIALLPCIKY